MTEDAIEVPKGIYVHSKTGNLYFVNEDVDCMGKETGDVPGVSYYRLYKPGKRCIRTNKNFFEEISIGDQLNPRFVLLLELSIYILRFLIPGTIVCASGKYYVVRNLFSKDGLVYIKLAEYYLVGEDIDMTIDDYLNS